MYKDTWKDSVWRGKRKMKKRKRPDLRRIRPSNNWKKAMNQHFLGKGGGGNV